MCAGAEYFHIQIIKLLRSIGLMKWSFVAHFCSTAHAKPSRKHKLVGTKMRRWHGEQICSTCMEIYLHMKDCHWGQWQQFSYLEYLETKPVLWNLFDQSERELELSLKVSSVVTSRPLGVHPFCKGRNLSFHMHLS